MAVSLSMPSWQDLRVGNEQVVAHELDLLAEVLGQLLPAVPIAFAQAVFDGDDGVFFHQFIKPGDHLVGGLVALAGFFQFIHAGFRIVEFAGGHVHGDADFFARLVACRLNGFHDAFERRFVVFQVGGKAALVTHSGNLAFFLQNALQGMEGLRAHADGFLHTLGADRHNHEFLEVHRGIRMAAAIQYVHHRHRQGLGIDAAQIAVQRQAVYVRSRMSAQPEKCPGWRLRRTWTCPWCRPLRSKLCRWRPGLLHPCPLRRLPARCLRCPQPFARPCRGNGILSPSRSSSASRSPVEAPLGTMARPK